jgi:hypothetical protein
VLLSIVNILTCHGYTARWNTYTGYWVVNAIDNQYCCGHVVSVENNSIECAVDRAFTVAQGTVIPGVAALANYSSSSSSVSPSASGSNGNNSSGASPDTSDDGDQSTRLAIGLGLGIPLGLIAGSALIWGAWERKQRAASRRELEELKASTAGMTMGPAHNQYGHGYSQVPAAPPVEIGQYSAPISELDSSGAKSTRHR